MVVKNQSTPIRQIVLKGIVNPSESCLLQAESVIKVEAFENVDLKYIQSARTIQPSLGCIDSCLSCLVTNKTMCTSCSLGYFLTVDGKCVAVCPVGTFSDTKTGSCLPCALGCVSCSDKPDICLKCTDPLEIVSENGQCIKKSSCTGTGYFVSETDGKCK